MIVQLLIEHHLEFLSLKGGCRGSCESTLVKMSNCWKSHAALISFHFILKSSHIVTFSHRVEMLHNKKQTLTLLMKMEKKNNPAHS